jgi:ADP-heptose:LPS heptosyltransferase
VIALPDPLGHALNHQGRDLTVMVIRLGAMGDILRTIPPVRLLRAALPRARLVWIVDEQWGVLLDGHGDLDRVLTVPRRRWDGLARTPADWGLLLASVRDFKQSLRAEGAGLLIDFHGKLRSGLIAGWSRAPVRVGYSGHQQAEGNRLFCTHHVPSGDRRTPRMERNLSLIRALGIPDSPLPGAALPLAEAGGSAVEEVLAALPESRAGLAVLSPGASVSQAYKKPPAALLAAACRSLERRGVLPLVVWGPGEEEDARAVVDRARGTAVLAPPTRLPALAALLSRSRIFVGGDTGPLHMACAVGCPVVGIYGPTDPVVNQPWGVRFRTVFPTDRRYTGIKRIDREAGGFEGIEIGQVEQAVDRILDEPAAASSSTRVGGDSA